MSCAPAPPQSSGVGPTPRVTRLSEAVPNPAHGAAELRLALAASGPVEVAVFSVDGRRVRTLARGWRMAGETTLTWDGRDDEGHDTGSGVYLVRLAAGGTRQVRRVVRVR